MNRSEVPGVATVGDLGSALTGEIVFQSGVLEPCMHITSEAAPYDQV